MLACSERKSNTIFSRQHTNICKNRMPEACYKIECDKQQCCNLQRCWKVDILWLEVLFECSVCLQINVVRWSLAVAAHQGALPWTPHFKLICRRGWSIGPHYTSLQVATMLQDTTRCKIQCVVGCNALQGTPYIYVCPPPKYTFQKALCGTFMSMTLVTELCIQCVETKVSSQYDTRRFVFVYEMTLICWMRGHVGRKGGQGRCQILTRINKLHEIWSDEISWRSWPTRGNLCDSGLDLGYTWSGGEDGVKIFLFQIRTLLPSTSIWNGRTCI